MAASGGAAVWLEVDLFLLLLGGEKWRFYCLKEEGYAPYYRGPLATVLVSSHCR